MSKNDSRDVAGLKIFLIAILELIKSGKKETCKDIEDNMGGISKYLMSKYGKIFDKYRSNDYTEIDAFYKNCDNKFNGEEDEGLYWLIEQAIKDLH